MHNCYIIKSDQLNLKKNRNRTDYYLSAINYSFFLKIYFYLSAVIKLFIYTDFVFQEQL